ncbi:hypothetical protein THF1C08_840005 [Vibrio jasicida]|uniref:Uncharacterized protein n=1 Tax=Vibrio jasicida TaxID=766224 RepID=A0AAU9R091_9VIBR|nr:hypothetical protein THF1C08_840005 [Vibrio jasicida]CAH1603874.1 hypothetical protein THF1A12_860005 [Vibrio jasicida]
MNNERILKLIRERTDCITLGEVMKKLFDSNFEIKAKQGSFK